MGTEVSGDGSKRFFATDSPERFARVGAIFLGRPIEAADVELIDLTS
jgi:glutamate racemase